MKRGDLFTHPSILTSVPKVEGGHKSIQILVLHTKLSECPLQSIQILLLHTKLSDWSRKC